MTTFGMGVGPVLLGIGILAFLGGIIDQDEEGLAASALFSFWGAVITTAAVRSRRHGTTYLSIDMPRGMATFVEERLERGTVPLHELGALTVETVRGEHVLHAAGLPKAALYRSPTLLPVEQRRVQIERLVGQHAVRQVLLNDAPNDGAFRDDPDLAFRARAAVPDRVRLNEVLDTLDEDWTIHDRVKALRAALARDR